MAKSRGNTAGYASIVGALAISCFWVYWGVIENFHEGWYYRSFWANIGLAFGQYLIWPLLFIGISVLSIYRPRFGAAVFVFIGLGLNAILFKFRNFVGLELVLGPCIILALLFCYGRVQNKTGATRVLIGVPLLICLAVGIPLYYRVSHRLTNIENAAIDWNTGHSRLFWAPPGPGWPTRGVSLREARRICSLLDASGEHLLNSPSNVWRLPTADEAVSALNRDGQPAGCRYSGMPGFQECDKQPDKEAPMWDPYSMVIYWWTSSESSSTKQLRVSYNGYVLPVPKGSVEGYTSFRAVKTRW